MGLDLSTLHSISQYVTYPKYLEAVLSAGSESTDFFGGRFTGGYHLQQRPEEMAALLTFLCIQNSTRPIKQYLEVGSASGGFIRLIHEQLGFEKAVMIDDGKWREDEQSANISGFFRKVSRNTLNSHSCGAQEALKGHQFNFIMVDGDHSYDGIMADVRLALMRLAPRGLIAFHDVHAIEEAPEAVVAFGDIIRIFSNTLRLVANYVKRDERTPLGIAVFERIN